MPRIVGRRHSAAQHNNSPKKEGIALMVSLGMSSKRSNKAIILIFVSNDILTLLPV
jgi:hypothetical protein